MPTPKKSTAVLAATGAFKQNPQRAEGRGSDLETIGELGAPPATLSPTELDEWNRIVSFYPPGTLKSGHWYAVLMLAKLGAKAMHGEMTAAEMAQFKGYLSEMGLTLRSAANVQIPKAKAYNEFSEI